MTRIEELKAMKGPQLIIEADKLGVKVKCDKVRKKLVESKAALIDRILAFEAENAAPEMPGMVDDEFTPEQLKEIDEAIASMHGDDQETTEIEEMKGEPIEGIQEGTFEEVDGAKELVVTPQEKPAETIVPTPKRGALIEWNGKSQNICAWAKELGISANTLYGRIYKLGWTVDKAFTKKGRK